MDETEALPPQHIRRWFELFNEIGILAQLSRALFEAALPEGLTVPHFSVLNHLVRLGDGQNPVAIARAFQLPKTSMTHTLSVLEKRHLIEMRPDPRDGRGKCVFLTEAGRSFRERAIGALAPALMRMAGQIDPSAPDRLIPELRVLREVLDRNRP